MFKGWEKKLASKGLGLPRFSLPTAAAGRHPGAHLRPRELKSWLQTLDNPNPLLNCKALLEQVEILARFPGNIPKLPELMQLLDVPVHELLSNANYLLDEARPNEASKRAAEQFLPKLSDLLREVGHLQKRVINELLDATKGPSPQVLISALEVLAWQLRIDLTRYQGTPPETWRDMLLIFQVAEFCGTTGLMVENESGEERNAHALFFGSLLFLLCDPLRLPARNTWQLFQYAQENADQVELKSAKDDPKGIPVDFSGTTPPLVFARHPGLDTNGKTRFLHVARLLKVLKNNTAQNASLDLIAHSLNSLTNKQAQTTLRHEQRVPRRAEYQMFVGLLSIHRRLADFSPSSEPGFTEQAPKSLPCYQLDHSHSGAGFAMQGKHARNIVIGELVLLETQSRRDPSREVGFVAQIKRLRSREDGFLEIGVEKLNGRLKPVRAKVANIEEHGLLRQTEGSQEFQLIASRFRVAADTLFQMTDPSGGWSASARTISEQTEAYEPIAVRLVS